MSENDRAMTTLSTSEVRANFAEVLDRVRVQGTRFVVEKNGRAVAAVVSVHDLERLNGLEDAIDLREAAKARNRNDFVPWEQVKARLAASRMTPRSKTTKTARRRA